MNLKIKAAILSTVMLLSFNGVNAASIDDELSILAAEQEDRGDVEVFVPEGSEDSPSKSKKELREEKKRQEEEREAARKKLKEERDKARAEVSGKKPATKNPSPLDRTPTTTQTPKVETVTPPVTETPKVEPAASKVVETPPVVENSVGMPNPVVEYQSFEEMVSALNFTPLYIPKKSGYTITAMATIGGNLGEIRYGRRWEPEVSLRVRTYRRPAGEELRDVSGVSGVKWRIDKTSGSTIYIAKINDNSHVAAWSAGNYTFSAHVENLSFAAFHTIVADELVDLSTHYYLN